MDVVLELVTETAGVAIAYLCSRYLLIELRSSQARFMIPTQNQPLNPIVIAAEKWIDTDFLTPYFLYFSDCFIDKIESIPIAFHHARNFMNSAAGKLPASIAGDQIHHSTQLASRSASDMEDRLLQRQEMADQSQQSLQLHDLKQSLSAPPSTQKPIQAKKGDPDDPHKAHESKPVYLAEVQEAVVVPGLAGCAAMRVNVFQNDLEGKRLAHSAVLHSEGGVERSIAAADQINGWIKAKAAAGLSVEIFVMYNGAHKPAESDHAPVLRALTQGLSELDIPHTTKTEIVKSSSDFIEVDLTGTEEEIMERYHGRLKVAASPELTDYRSSQFMINRNKLVKNGVTKEGLDDWIYRWGNTESREEVDELIIEASTSKKKKSGLCYLTTACVEFAGLPDDCHELTVLRHFRDHYLAQRDDGAHIIAEYYAIAPDIVKAIDNKKNRAQIYAGILTTVRTCVEEIEASNMEKAMQRYHAMVRQLQKDIQQNAHI